MNLKPSLKNKNKSVVFNYSDVVLTEPMEQLLNRGLNFSILPNKMDLTQVLTDFKRFERSVVWHEFWYGREKDVGEERKEPIFPTHKTNMPKNHTVPEGLKVFLNSVKSELTDPRNRNKEECNLPVDELNALKQLIQLQKDRIIVIKACDKGAGIIILNFNDYMKACYDHLLSKTEDGIPYYSKVDDLEVERAKHKIKQVLEEGLEQGIISKFEFDAMIADEKMPGRYYSNFKVHKPNIPVRPILSGCGSLTEGIATFVEHQIRHIATTHDTYLQDTPDFLRTIERINKGPRLSQNAILVTFDVKALFTNIKHNDGLQCLQEQLEDRKQPEVSSDYILKLMDLLLHQNIFSFHDTLWKQEVGAAMGSKPIPSYANIFMARTIDKAIKLLAKKYNKDDTEALQLMKRFLDDIFGIFNGSTKMLHDLFDEINQIHPTIKLTMNHTSIADEAPEVKCDCEEKSAIPFLDTLCSIKNGRIDTDLYKKPTDRNQYLLPSSCHSKMTTKAIPMSLGLRIVRICSDTDKRDKRMEELKGLLLERGYSEGMVDSALERAKKVPRKAALKKVAKKVQTKRPVFAVTYDPRLPSITNLQAKHWRSMVSRDKYLGDVFPSPPLTAYKRQPNIRSHIIRAAVSKGPSRYPQRNQRSMTKCNIQDCTACPFIKEGKEVKINGVSWRINKQLNCKTYNIVYAIICKKDNCKEVYIGETKHMLKFRLAQHRGYVQNKDNSKATGQHFNMPGHSLADLMVTIIEQVKKSDTLYRKEREEYHIRSFNTLHKGINRKI